MDWQRTGRVHLAQVAMRHLCTAALLAGLLTASAQSGGQDSDNPGGTTLDRVVAVVNRQPILASDLQDEMQLSVLEPSARGQSSVSPQQAMERLISRTLIEQQIQQEEAQMATPKPEQIATRLHEIRTETPACVRAGCNSDAGWTAFLARHELTPKRVEDYLRHRLEILSFIELRFRQGIRISPEEIEAYYRGTLLPQYPAGQTPPSLQQVSSRIEEILLQQQVNALFDSWLANLRKQGQIEVLDTALEPSDEGSEGAAKE